MIQLNMEAKPYNPCEEVIGTSLFLSFQQVKWWGSRGWKEKPDEQDSYDVMVKMGFGKFDKHHGQILNQGWKEGIPEGFILPGGSILYTKENKKLLLVYENYLWNSLITAMDVCKYIETGPGLDKQAAKDIHLMIVNNFRLVEKKVEDAHEDMLEEEMGPDDNLDDVPQMGQFGHIPNELVQMNVAPHAAQGVVAGQFAQGGGLNAAPQPVQPAPVGANWWGNIAGIGGN